MTARNNRARQAVDTTADVAFYSFRKLVKFVVITVFITILAVLGIVVTTAFLFDQLF